MSTSQLRLLYRSVNNTDTAISRNGVGKSARDNPERYCGWFWVRCSSKKFERMTQKAVDVCLRVLKESNKTNFYSYSVRNSVLIISHITFQDCRVHIFADNLSQNSCMSTSQRGLPHNSDFFTGVLTIRICPRYTGVYLTKASSLQGC